MSIEAVNWALTKADTRTPTEAIVLAGLANHAWPDGTDAYPAIAKLADYARISERTVQRTLRDLEDRGLVKRGDQSVVRGKPANYRPVVYDLPLNDPRFYRVEESTPRGDNLSPLDRTTQGSRGDTGGATGVTPVSDNPSLGPIPSYESADAHRVTRSTRVVRTSSQPKVTEIPRRPRRTVTPEEGPETGRVVGVRASTSRADRARQQRSTVNPDSAGGLAKHFGERAKELTLSGPQDINGPALASHLTRWMRSDRNPDTPERIREMMEEFFRSPGGQKDAPLWRRFLSDAPRLRDRHRKAQPVDYAAENAENRRWLEGQAAQGNARADKVLHEMEHPPWEGWEKKGPELAEQARQRADAKRAADAEQAQYL